MPQQNAAMFIVARQARGLTQRELSVRLGVHQGAVSKIETGVQPASETQLDAYVRELRFPRSFFEQSLAVRTLPPHYWRKKAKAKKVEEHTVEAKTSILRMQLRTLLLSADVPSNTVPIFDRGTFDGTPSDAARLVREKWMVPRGPISNMTRLLEDHGMVIVPSDLGTDAIDGMSVFDPSDGLPPLVLVNPKAPGDRLRWSLAHELGHVVLHTDPNYIHDKKTEDEADEFAAAFTMPSSDIGRHLRNVAMEQLATLKLTWKMSIAALLKRAQTLGSISDWKAASLWKELNWRGWRLQEPNPIAVEDITLISEIVSFHKEDLSYTDQQMEKAIHMFAQEIRETFLLSSQSGLRVVK